MRYCKKEYDLSIKFALQQAALTQIYYYILYPHITSEGLCVPCVRADYLVDSEREDVMLTVFPSGTIKYGLVE